MMSKSRTASQLVRIAKRLTGRKQALLTSQIKKKLPPLYSQENEKDPIVYAKFFSPYSGSSTWLATEFDGRDTFFGAVSLGHGWESGYFSLRELEGIKGPMGVQGIERDAYFKSMPLSRAKRA